MMFSSRASAAYNLGLRLLNCNATTRLHGATSQTQFSTTVWTSETSATNGSNANVEDRLLRREDFVHPDHVKLALDKGTMFVFAGKGDLKEVPMADSIKEFGVVPSGYSIDFVASPERIISVLNQAGIKTIGQLPEETYHELRATINSSANLSIIPTRAYELKRQLQMQTDGESDENK
ncbi:hypothetical protein J3R30DRAFT_3434978 [Lentinula aciculospora]|uniref:Uncharacterized protein n=1 Tax=Lentinula aciculospora TaxID=153920 RepID=A0A9W9AQF9_9AGAR|nr:hypothetical protein J3R30DRAFT_3434978 [Lentinula aciculospora]